MNPIHIRSATPQDIPAITAIYDHAVRFGTATFEIDPPDAAEMAKRHQRIVTGGFPFLAAEQDGRVIGYAYADLYRVRPGYRYTVEDSIYLAPDAQGRGTGTRLLQTLIAQCEALGFRQMIAVIGDAANQSSIRLHARAGFTPSGSFTQVGFKFGRWVDTVLMQRALGAGGTTLPGTPG
jgi:phosphinothricin acetyltransferase